MRGPRPDRLHAWWATSLASLLPSIGMCGVGAGALAGGGLKLGGGLLALGVGAALLHARRGQPAIDRRFAELRPEGIARRFLLRTLVTRSLADLALELGDATSQLAAADRVLLLCTGAGGRRQLLGGDGDDERRVGDVGPALGALAQLGVPVERASLLEASGAGAQSILALLDALDVSWAAPLIHRDLLIGVLLCGRFREGGEAREDRAAALELMATHATTALARALLEEARRTPVRRGSGLGKTVPIALGPRGVGHTDGALAVAWARVAIEEAGGDLVIVEPRDQGRTLIVLADGVGRGASAVLAAARVHGAVLALPNAGPEEVLRAADEALRAEGAMAVAALAALVDPARRMVELVSAGLPPPILLERKDGEPRARALVPERLGRPRLPSPAPRSALGTARAPTEPASMGLGTPLGEAGSPLELATSRVTLTPDDRLVLVTDGVLTAGAPYAHPLGLLRLTALVAALAEQPTGALPGAVLAEVGRLDAGRPSADDRSVIALGIASPEAKPPSSLRETMKDGLL